VFDVTQKQREQLELIRVGDRVAITARTGRVYVETVASVMDDRIIVPRGEYHIHNGRSCDPFCGDMLRGLATEDDLLKTRAQATAAKQKRDVQKRERERRRDEDLAKQGELSSLLTPLHASLRPSESCQGYWLLDALTESAVRMIGAALKQEVERRRTGGSGMAIVRETDD
jgi:hypothetical protein